MKTLLKLLFLLAVINLAAGCSQQDEILNDSAPQLKSADNRTIQWWFQPSKDQWNCPVICDGETVDFLVADGESLTIHAVGHLVKGQMTKVEFTVHGTLKSEWKGENFRVHDHGQLILEEDGGFRDELDHVNLVGDQGTHFLCTIYVASDEDFVNGVYELIKAMCVPNSGKKDK